MTLDREILAQVNNLFLLEETLCNFCETHKKEIMQGSKCILDFLLENLTFIMGSQTAQHVKDELLHNDEKINETLNNLKKYTNMLLEKAFYNVIEYRKDNRKTQ